MKFTSLVLFTILSKVFAVEKTEAGNAVSQDNKDKNVSEKNQLPPVPENLDLSDKQEGSTDEDNGTATPVNEKEKDPKGGSEKNESNLLGGGQPEKTTEKQDVSTTASAPAAPVDNKEANKTEEEKAQAEKKAAEEEAERKAKEKAEQDAKDKAKQEEKEKAEANKNNTAGTGSSDTTNEKTTNPKEGPATSTKTAPTEASNTNNAPTDPKPTGNYKAAPSTTETAPATGAVPSSGDKPNKDSTGEEKEKKSTDWKKYLLWGTLGVCVVGFIVVIALMASK